MAVMQTLPLHTPDTGVLKNLPFRNSILTSRGLLSFMRSVKLAVSIATDGCVTLDSLRQIYPGTRNMKICHLNKLQYNFTS